MFTDFHNVFSRNTCLSIFMTVAKKGVSNKMFSSSALCRIYRMGSKCLVDVLVSFVRWSVVYSIWSPVDLNVFWKMMIFFVNERVSALVMSSSEMRSAVSL